MASIGLSGCDIGISYFLPRVVGANLASEMMMGGRFILAERAERCGFCTLQPDVAQAGAEALALADDMLALSPMGLALTKQGFNAALSASSLESQVALEDRQQTVVGTLPDFPERAMAFLAKSGGRKKAGAKL